MPKTVNYTPEMTTDLVEAYTAADTDAERKAVVSTFAREFGKSTKSIVAKLSREKVYVPVERKGKKGGVKKADLVDTIAERVPMPSNDAESLTKATMGALKAVLAALPEPDEADED